MNREEIVRKLKICAPILSIVLVAACVGNSLSGYEPPVFAAETVEEESKETIPEGTEPESEREMETEQETEEAVQVKGAFDLEDGIYQGTGTGFAGDVTVSVQIKDCTIVSIEILSSLDDEPFFNRAKGVIDKMISTQSLEVDVVSGATYSSNGMINAVKNALTGEVDTTQAESVQSSAGTSSSAPTIGAVEDASAYKDGTYYGTGTGFRGAIKAEVVVSGGAIASIRIIENSDDSSYIASASAVIDRMISGQTTNVDTVSGATYSSNGIIQAVRNALSQAAVNEENQEQSGAGQETGTGDENDTEDDASVTGTIPYVDGIYYGTAEGFTGDITTAVVIQDQTIKAILVMEASDDEPFFTRAMDVVKNVVKTQSTEVDTVSGATYSSQGLLGAIKNALEEAKKVTNGEAGKSGLNTESLQQTISQAETLDEADYTPASWMLLQIRLQDAREAQDYSAQEYIDKAEQKLRAAMNALVESEESNGESDGSGSSDDENGEDRTEDEDNRESGNESEESGEGSDHRDEPLTTYQDGTYQVKVLCLPDEDEDFESYNLSLKITVQNDKIISITDIQGDGDTSNHSYIKRAANGTSSRPGVVTQIINQGMPEGIDTVSRATCTSKSIIEACEIALQNALRQ